MKKSFSKQLQRLVLRGTYSTAWIVGFITSILRRGKYRSELSRLIAIIQLVIIWLNIVYFIDIFDSVTVQKNYFSLICLIGLNLTMFIFSIKVIFLKSSKRKILLLATYINILYYLTYLVFLFRYPLSKGWLDYPTMKLTLLSLLAVNAITLLNVRTP